MFVLCINLLICFVLNYLPLNYIVLSHILLYCITEWQAMCIVFCVSVLITFFYCNMLYCLTSYYIVSYWCRRGMIICKTGWQPVTAGGSSMITMQCTATLRISEKNIWYQNVKKRKTAVLRSQWPATFRFSEKKCRQYSKI